VVKYGLTISSYQGAFKMITRRQGGSGEGILGYVEELTTKPTQLAFECDVVSLGTYEI